MSPIQAEKELERVIEYLKKQYPDLTVSSNPVAMMRCRDDGSWNGSISVKKPNKKKEFRLHFTIAVNGVITITSRI